MLQTLEKSLPALLDPKGLPSIGHNSRHMSVEPKIVPVHSLMTLVLNADFQPLTTYPLSLIPASEAITRLWKNRANMVESWKDAFGNDQVFRSPSVTIPAPKVVVLREYVGISNEPKFSRRAILLRDRFCCFTEGTRILMADGRQTPIEDVRIGDRVIDAFGKIVNVVNTDKRIADNCVAIKHRGSFERTIVTSEHPFLVDHGDFSPIKDIEITERRGGGMLRIPRCVQYDIDTPVLLDITKLLPQDKWYRLHNERIFRTKKPNEQGIAATIQQSSALAYLLGLYVAEGCFTKQGVVSWNFSLTERNTLAADVEKFAAEVFGLRVYVDINTDRNTCVVRVGSKTLSEILSNFCGKGSKNKKTPWELIGPFRADYLRGLFAGDGCISKKRSRVVLSMTGYDAVIGAQSMLWGFGIHPSFQKIERDGRLAAFTIVLAAENYSKFMIDIMNDDDVVDGEQIFGDSTHVFRRLQERENFDGEHIVYNFETDGSHSYIANGLSVHNCQYCGRKFAPKDLTFDHVIPKTKGGRTIWSNIVSACTPCNTKKGSKLPQYSGRKGKKGNGLRPLKEPYQPTNAELMKAGLEFLPDQMRLDWGSWLYWTCELDES